MPAYLKNRLLVLLVIIFLQPGVSILEPGSTRLVETDIDFCFSDKYVGKIYPKIKHICSICSCRWRNGRLWKYRLRKYKDDFRQFFSKRVEFNTGDHIAKIPFQKKESPDFIEVTDFDSFHTKEVLEDLAQQASKLWLLIIIFLSTCQMIFHGTKAMF